MVYRHLRAWEFTIYERPSVDLLIFIWPAPADGPASRTTVWKVV